ncbi:MAG: YidC/Oxa1 family membrane protein insertase [Patescibacteria group bacterium]|nr:YidC/Oxa1 family membrane protein insertase [Patescibacteria group bacterium]
MGFIEYFITVFVYQPFFNLLVYIYLFLDKVTSGQADMGLAVIIFTVIFRIIILPLSLKADRSEKEKREISQKVESIEHYYRDNPIKKREEVRKLLAANPKVIGWEFFDLFIQVLIAIMLYRIFTTGLEGSDLHLLYSFMPKIQTPFNMMFLGRFDLSRPSILINIVNTAVIFTAEFLSIRFSPFPMTREDKMMLGVLPVGAFTFFAFMPAGKKLFVVTTLLFSIFLILARQLIYVYHNLRSGGRSLEGLKYEVSRF